MRAHDPDQAKITLERTAVQNGWNDRQLLYRRGRKEEVFENTQEGGS